MAELVYAWVSKTHGGNSLRVRFPLLARKRTVMTESLNKVSKKLEYEPERGKVLVVDDDEGYARNIPRLLKTIGLDAQVATSSDEAQLLLMKNNYCGVIVDGLNGKWTRVAKAALDLNIPVRLYTTTPATYKHHVLIDNGQVQIFAKGEVSIEELTAGFKLSD